MPSRIRSASKKRFSSLFSSRSSTPSGSGSNMNAASSGGDPGPFLHLKFGVGRPPPHEHEVHEGGGSAPQLLLFAHEIELDPEKNSRNLHETLRADVQRAGIARWLEQNFKEDAYIYDVVHRRQGDRGMFALVTKNWARSVGDPKLHLSLYVYQDHMHVATWHAYSDRSVSYSRAGDENAPPPEGSDPYSTPEALEAAASAALPTSSSSSSKEHDDDGRPRFDRPAALPTESSDLEDTDEVPFKPEEVVQSPSVAKNGRSSRSARKQPPPATTATEEPESDASSSAQAEEEEQRQSKRPSRRPMVKSESESDRSSDTASRSRFPSPSPSLPPQPSKRSSRRTPRPPPSDAQSLSSADEADGPTYPIVKSQPLGESRSDRHGAESESRPSPPSPTKKKSERGRDRTPVSPVAQSLSPPPAASRKGETDRLAQQQRERSRRRARPAAVPEPEPEPSPSTSRSRSRSPSPVRNPRTERGRRSARELASAFENEQESERPIADVRRRDRSARRPKPPRSPSPSPSRSETPPTKSKASTVKSAVEAKKDRVYERASRSESRSPSAPVRKAKTQSKRSTRQDSEVETRKSEDERPHRGRSRAPIAPTAPPQLDRKPSWRSVSRNRHRRNGSDSSGDDTLVRGNLVDADLDIPAGGEATLLTAKRRASISERSARRPSRSRRDDSFDPEEVQQPPRPVVDPPKPQTATAVLGSWIKSVGTLLKPEVEPTATANAIAADSEAEELEARLRRKAERAERRKARAARRAARQTDASAFEDTEADRTASEGERSGRSSRRRSPQEDEPRRSRRQAETEESVSNPARPALRERAMSFSATLDSGFKNLRESVNKIVSGADEPPNSASSAESEVIDRRRSRHRAHSRKRRENPEEESGPELQRRRIDVEELPDQSQSRAERIDKRRSRSERPELTEPQRKLRERSRRREVEPKEGQDDPVQQESRSQSTRSAPPPVTSPSDDDDALRHQRRAQESAHVRGKSAIDEDASDLPTRSSSRATESSSRVARRTRPPPPRVDDSSSLERRSSRRSPPSDGPPRQHAQSTKDREDGVAADRTTSRSARSSSATADSGTAANSKTRAKYVEDRNAAADRERARHDCEKERRVESSVPRSRPSSAHQSTLKPTQAGYDDFSDERSLPRRRQVGQVALDDAAPAEQVRSSSSSAACSPSVSTPSLSTISDFAAPEQQQQRRSRSSTSRPADVDHSRGGNDPRRGRNLTDAEEESRFVAARGSPSTVSPISDRRTPSRTTVTCEQRDEGECIPPIPAPAPLSTRSSLPTYGDSGPLLRPQPHRAQHQLHQLQLPFGGGAGRAVPDSKSHSYPNLNSASDGKRTSASRATTRSHLLQHHDSSLPRTTMFRRRNQPVFDPVSASSSVADSDSDSDSDSQEEENDGEATSDPNSVAFRRRRRRRRHDQSDRQLDRMGDWNDSRGQRAPSRRFEGVADDDDDDDDDDDGTLRGRDGARPRQGDEGAARPGRSGGGGDYDSGDYYDYDGEGSLFQQSAAAATPLSNRSAPTTSSFSPSAKNRRIGDAAPSSTAAASLSSSSRANVLPGPNPSRTSTKSRTMVSPRPPLSSLMPGYPAAAAAPETVDREGGWRDLQQSVDHFARHGQLGLGLGSLSPPDQGEGTSASFDRLTAKGRESGSVQLFGRHNAPVSRRMARRLGMS